MGLALITMLVITALLTAGYGVVAYATGKIVAELAQANASKRALGLALQNKDQQLLSLRRERCSLQNTLAYQRSLITNHHKANKFRLQRALFRNGASGVAGLIPVVGDIADAGATGVDLWEYRQMSIELEQLRVNSMKNLAFRKCSMLKT